MKNKLSSTEVAPTGNGAAQEQIQPAAKTADGKNTKKSAATKSSTKDDAAKTNTTAHRDAEANEKSTAAGKRTSPTKPNHIDTHEEESASQSQNSTIPKGLLVREKVSLKINGELTKEVAECALVKLKMLKEANSWHIGDLLLATDHLGEGTDRALAKKLGYKYGSLANMKSVSNNIPVSLRREDLSWDHHRIVAKLATKQEKKVALAWAANGHKSTRELFKHLNPDSGSKQGSIPGLKALQQWLTKADVNDWDDDRVAAATKAMESLRIAAEKMISKLGGDVAGDEADE